MRPALLALLVMTSCLAAAGVAANPQVAEGRRPFLDTCARCLGEDGARAPRSPSSRARWGCSNAPGSCDWMTIPFDHPARLGHEQGWAVRALLRESHGALGGAAEFGPGNAAAMPSR